MEWNKVTLMGRLTQDPETRYTPKGTAVTNANLAVNRKYVVDGDKREEVAFIDLTIWGARGEAYAKYVQKGDLTIVEGYLKMDQWDDKETGKKRSKLSVTVEKFEFLPNNREGRRDGPQEPQQRQEPSYGRQDSYPSHSGPPDQQGTAGGPFGTEDEEDDIPF